MMACRIPIAQAFIIGGVFSLFIFHCDFFPIFSRFFFFVLFCYLQSTILKNFPPYWLTSEGEGMRWLAENSPLLQSFFLCFCKVWSVCCFMFSRCRWGRNGFKNKKPVSGQFSCVRHSNRLDNSLLPLVDFSWKTFSVSFVRVFFLFFSIIFFLFG